MKPKSFNLDWNAGAELYEQQEVVVNQFLETHTFVTGVCLGERFVVGYTDDVPLAPCKVKVFNYEEVANAYGLAQTDSIMDDFLSTREFVDVLKSDEGFIILIYR